MTRLGYVNLCTYVSCKTKSIVNDFNNCEYTRCTPGGVGDEYEHSSDRPVASRAMVIFGIQVTSRMPHMQTLGP